MYCDTLPASDGEGKLILYDRRNLIKLKALYLQNYYA